MLSERNWNSHVASPSLKKTDNFCSKGEHQHDIAKFLKAKEPRKASKSNESTIKDII